MDAILRNPRYTGQQVWNRQRKDDVLLDVADVTIGTVTKQRWNNPDAWIYSDHAAHPAIISAAVFDQAGQVIARGSNATRQPHRTARPYVFLGLLHCGLCGRGMQGSWNNDQAYYRCRLPGGPA